MFSLLFASIHGANFLVHGSVTLELTAHRNVPTILQDLGFHLSMSHNGRSMLPYPDVPYWIIHTLTCPFSLNFSLNRKCKTLVAGYISCWNMYGQKMFEQCSTVYISIGPHNRKSRHPLPLCSHIHHKPQWVQWQADSLSE